MWHQVRARTKGCSRSCAAAGGCRSRAIAASRGHLTWPQQHQSVAHVKPAATAPTHMRPRAAQSHHNGLAVGDPLGRDYEQNLPRFDKARRAGVILHPTSLPGPYGIGDLGESCHRFIDWLASAGLQCWQVLPLVPPDPKYYSPYSGLDANSGNPLLISIDALVADGLLKQSEAPEKVPVASVNFDQVAATKYPLLKAAAGRLLHDHKFSKLRSGWEKFTKENKWVEDSALFDIFRNLPECKGLDWWDWPEPLRLRTIETVRKAKEQYRAEIDEYSAIQFLFDRQWEAAKKYANARSIQIIGDMPIYVGGQSADVWASQHLFELTESGVPSLVSGVPPDAFSDTGQLWGNPLYRWAAHRSEDYDWWTKRIARAASLYDITRIDHFRAFAGYWRIPATAKTAMEGEWCKGPGKDLFDAVERKLGVLPILAEDLGVITADVVELREAIKAPGMVVLQFAWGGGPTNVHLPHMHHENSYCYPGTHDNETAVGWWKHSATDTDRDYLKAYLNTTGDDIAWDFIRASMQSVSKTCLFLMQDVMRQDNSARMNYPGKAAGNWAWRMGDDSIWNRLEKEANDLQFLTSINARGPRDTPDPLVDVLGGASSEQDLGGIVAEAMAD